MTSYLNDDDGDTAADDDGDDDNDDDDDDDDDDDNYDKDDEGDEDDHDDDDDDNDDDDGVTVSSTGHRPAQRDRHERNSYVHARCPPLLPTPKTIPDQHTENPMPYSLPLMCGFFNVPEGYEHSSVVRRDLRFDLLHYKGSTFSSVI